MSQWTLSPPRPLVMAHRGDRTRALENTLAAFTAACEIGAECIELDVRPTADGQVVVFHDATLARLAGRGERVDEMTLDALRGIRLDDDHVIPTLDEVFEAIAPDMLLDIEIKSDRIGRSNGIADRVVDCVRRHDAFERCLVSSFDPFVLFRTRRLASELRIGYLFHQPSAGWLTRVLAPYAVHPINTLVDADTVTDWHRRGYAVHPWNVDGTAELTRMQQLGVEAVCTNDPEKALKLYDGG